MRPTLRAHAIPSLRLGALLMIVACRPSLDDAAPRDDHDSRAVASSHSAPTTVRSDGGMLRTTLRAAPGKVSTDGRVWEGMLYNGAYLPPVLRVQPGDSVRLRLINALPAGQFTNLHYHGTAISPRPPSDYVLTMIPSADTSEYALFFPPAHDRGLFWYHPHPHGQSEGQVLAGLSGLLVVEGFLQEHYPWLKGVPEELLLLKDVDVESRPDSVGHLKLANGTANARFQIAPGELQFWRVANVGADAYFNFKIEGHRLWLLARDANALHTPQLVDSLFLPPGARAEVLLVGSAPGTHAIVHGRLDTGPVGDPNPTQTLGALVVTGPEVDRKADIARLASARPLPAIVSEIASVRDAPITRRRTFVFSESDDGKQFYINRSQFAMDTVNTRVTLGDTEEWTLVNNTGEWHVFHIHQLDFLVTAINGVVQSANSLFDTVNMPFAVRGRPSTVTLRIPFTDPAIAGKFVYHCHILEHEDAGMMQVIEVVSPDASSPVSGSAHAATRP